MLFLNDFGGYMNVTRDQIHNTLSNVLADYEEGILGIGEKELYDMLVEIQNRWEDTITCDDSQSYGTFSMRIEEK